MKSVKLFGLAMIAAVAAMAFIGAGTASAILCKKAESPCLEGNQYSKHATVLVSSEATKLTATFGGALCKSHATLLHEGINAKGELFGTFTLLDWTNCTGCKTATTTTLGKFTDVKTTGGNGTLHPEGVVVLLKECALGAECTATSNSETKLALTGGTINGTAQATAKTPVSVSGFGCGSTGTWETESTGPYVVLSVTESNGTVFTSGGLFLE